MREANQPLATSTIQPIIREMIESLAFDVLCDNKDNGFKVIQVWIHQFMEHYMNWTFRVSITIANKLSLDWEEQG
jgi:hypothetical protein